MSGCSRSNSADDRLNVELLLPPAKPLHYASKALESLDRAMALDPCPWHVSECGRRQFICSGRSPEAARILEAAHFSATPRPTPRVCCWRPLMAEMGPCRGGTRKLPKDTARQSRLFARAPPQGHGLRERPEGFSSEIMEQPRQGAECRKGDEASLKAACWSVCACSPLVDWPVYPRLRRNMRVSTPIRKCSTSLRSPGESYSDVILSLAKRPLNVTTITANSNSAATAMTAHGMRSMARRALSIFRSVTRGGRRPPLTANPPAGPRCKWEADVGATS